MPDSFTSSSPEEPGYYWYRNGDHDMLDVVLVYRRTDDSELYASGAMFEKRAVETMGGSWLGPLTPPDMSEEEVKQTLL